MTDRNRIDLPRVPRSGALLLTLSLLVSLVGCGGGGSGGSGTSLGFSSPPPVLGQSTELPEQIVGLFEDGSTEMSGALGTARFGGLRGLTLARGALYSFDDDELIRIPLDGSPAESVGKVVLEGFPPAFTPPENFDGLAVHPVTGECYAADEYTGTFVRIDLATARATYVGPGDDNPLYGFAFHPETGVLHGINGDELFTVDLTDGKRTNVGETTGVATPRGLCYDPARGAFLTHDDAFSTLFSLDPATATPTTVIDEVSWSGTSEPVRGLAMAGGTIHSISGNQNDALHHSIDPGTGAVALRSVVGPQIGTLSVHAGTIHVVSHGRILLRLDRTYARVISTVELSDEVDSIAHDAATGTLYCTALDPGIVGDMDLATIDPASGTVTRIGDTDAVRDLAVDPATGTIYGVDPGTERLVSIDPATGAQTVIDASFLGIRRLAFDSQRGRLVGLPFFQSELYVIDETDGSGSPLGPIFSGSAREIAYDAFDETFVAYDAEMRHLLRLDAAEGGGYPIGACSIDVLHAMATDASTGILYGTQPRTLFPDECLLFRIDPRTGVATGVHHLIGVGDIFSMTWDSVTGQLIAGTFGGDLVAIDPATGIPTPLGSIGFPFESLAHDPAGGDLLYGVAGTGLYTIDPDTMAAEFVGSTGGIRFSGLAFDAATGDLYGAGYPDGMANPPTSFYRIDPATGTTEFLAESPNPRLALADSP